MALKLNGAIELLHEASGVVAAGHSRAIWCELAGFGLWFEFTSVKRYHWGADASNCPVKAQMECLDF
jgi:hypothetical protein